MDLYKTHRRWHFIVLIASIISSNFCAMQAPEKGYEYLAPPVIINCEQQGSNIIVNLIGYNDEYYFDGYNVYVSTTSINRSGIESYRPVRIAESGYIVNNEYIVDETNYASCEPSYPLSPNDYNPEIVRSLTLYHYYVENEGQYDPYPFSIGTTYYIILCSHHRLGYVLPEGVSNQPDPIEFE